MHDVVAEMRRVVDEFESRVLIGEIYLPIERLVRLLRQRISTARNLPFNFALLSAPWNARAIAKIIADYEAALPPGAWPNWVLGNHDRPRVASRVGADQARVAAMLLLTLRGTPTLYYGDEIGMHQVRDRARPGAGSVREERAGHRRRPRRLPHADAMGRDRANAGFTTAHAVAAAAAMISSAKTSSISRRIRARSSASTRR